jgi:hypothetical protein
MKTILVISVLVLIGYAVIGASVVTTVQASATAHANVLALY